MDWYRLSFGAPQLNTNNKQVQRDHPESVDLGMSNLPGLPVAPSPFDGTKPGAKRRLELEKVEELKKRRNKKRRSPGPIPNLLELSKHPTDGTTTRPTGDLTASKRRQGETPKGWYGRLLRNAEEDVDAEDVDMAVEENADAADDESVQQVAPEGKMDTSREMQRLFRQVGWLKNNPAMEQLLKTKPEIAYEVMRSMDQAGPNSMNKAKHWFRGHDLQPAQQFPMPPKNEPTGR